MDHDARFLADLRDLKARIKDNWTLCNFAGKAEVEYMVATTIHAAASNLAAHGDPFSRKDPSVTRDGPHADNSASYARLLRRGWLVEVARDGETVIYPTRRLLDALLAFLPGRPAVA